jgi:two-component system, NarL family, response regulator DegU
LAESADVGVVVVDDNELVRQSIERWMTGSNGVRCLASVETVEEARRMADQFRPDVLLLDAEIPGGDTFSLIRWARTNYPSMKVVMLTGQLSQECLCTSLDLGASGYILKDESLPSIIDAIRRVAEGEIVLSPSVRSLVADHQAPPI